MTQPTNDMHLNIQARDTEWLDLRPSSTAAGAAADAGAAAGDAQRAQRAAADGGASSVNAAAGADADGSVVAAGKVRWSVPGGHELAAAGSKRYAAGSLSPFAVDTSDAADEAAGSPGRIGTAAAHSPPAAARLASMQPARLTDLGQLAAAAGPLGRPQRSVAGDLHSLAPGAATTSPELLAGGDEQQQEALGGELGAADGRAGGAAGSRRFSPDAGASSEGGGGGEQALGSFELFPALLQPSAGGADAAPDLAIIKVLDELPPDESAHLRNKGKRGRAAVPAGALSGSAAAAFKFYFGFFAEGTMAIEVRPGWGERGRASRCGMGPVAVLGLVRCTCRRR
jgi:hypothetical protein